MKSFDLGEKKMSKFFKVFLVSFIATMGFGQVFAQDVPNYAMVGYNMGSGVSTWASVAGPGGFGQMNFNPTGAALIDSYAGNQYGNVSVYARPWSNGSIQSGAGGTATVSSSFSGAGDASVQFSKEFGVGTNTFISKSISMSASSSGNGSAFVNGGFDVFIGASGFVPVVPVSVTIPSSGGKG